MIELANLLTVFMLIRSNFKPLLLHDIWPENENKPNSDLITNQRDS